MIAKLRPKSYLCSTYKRRALADFCISPCFLPSPLLSSLSLVLSAGNKDLEKLYLTECGLTEDGAKAIADVLKETKLKEV